MVKLNLGAGKRRLPGYLSVDIQQLGPAPLDIVSDFKRLPMLKDGCAEEILGVHIFEHMYRWEVDGALEEWKRLLVSDGLLALEMPDILKCARNLLEGDSEQMSYWGFWGDPRSSDPFMSHHWGWHARALKPVLEAHGFVNVVEQPAMFHQPKRDFRMEARKR